jgi:Tol biopolymer transport system component
MIAVALAAAAALAAPAQTDVQRQLAFSWTRNGNTDIYLVGANGKGLRRLTRSRARDMSPSWSADGTKLAFRTNRDGNDQVYVMNADGSAQRNLTRTTSTDYSPAWAPDGKAIAFASNRGGDSRTLDDIWLVDADGSNPRRLELRVGIDEYPVWSPDGNTIAFACTNDVILPQRVGDFEICLMNADGSDVRRVTDAPGLSIAWSWSPDGTRIAFDSSRRDSPYGVDEGGDLFLMDADGTHVRPLTRGPAHDAQPVFSPSGRHIAFTSNRRRRPGLYLMDANGSHVRLILRGSISDPAWRP